MSTELTTPIRIDIPGVGSIESADLYLKSEVDKVIDELKEERRWRKFPDEKPTKDKDIKCLVINEKGLTQCCYYSPILKAFQIPVTYWMPLQSAPKEGE